MLGVKPLGAELFAKPTLSAGMSSSSASPQRRGAVSTGYENGCVALEVSRYHPWPVALTAGDNLEDLKTLADVVNVKQHAANGHHYVTRRKPHSSPVWRTRRLRDVVVRNEDQRRYSTREVPPEVASTALVDQGKKRKSVPSTAQMRTAGKRPRLRSYGARYTDTE